MVLSSHLLVLSQPEFVHQQLCPMLSGREGGAVGLDRATGDTGVGFRGRRSDQHDFSQRRLFAAA